MMDAVQQTALLLSPTLFRRGRIMIAPPSVHNSCWRVFAGGLTAEVREQRELGVCSLALRGPDEKVLREGVTGNLPSALRLAVDLLHQLCEGGGAAS